MATPDGDPGTGATHRTTPAPRAGRRSGARHRRDPPRRLGRRRRGTRPEAPSPRSRPRGTPRRPGHSRRSQPSPKGSVRNNDQTREIAEKLTELIADVGKFLVPPPDGAVTDWVERRALLMLVAYWVLHARLVGGVDDPDLRAALDGLWDAAFLVSPPDGAVTDWVLAEADAASQARRARYATTVHELTHAMQFGGVFSSRRLTAP